MNERVENCMDSSLVVAHIALQLLIDLCRIPVEIKDQLF